MPDQATEDLSSSRPSYFLSLQQWDQIVSDYEFGYKNQTQLSHEYGVTPQAISQGLKRRGAVAGCKAMETPEVKALEAELDRRDEERRQRETRLWDRAMSQLDDLAVMMELLVEADEDGCLEAFPIDRFKELLT